MSAPGFPSDPMAAQWDRIRELEDEVARLRQDAERYWLREADYLIRLAIATHHKSNIHPSVAPKRKRANAVPAGVDLMAGVLDQPEAVPICPSDESSDGPVDQVLARPVVP